MDGVIEETWRCGPALIHSFSVMSVKSWQGYKPVSRGHRLWLCILEDKGQKISILDARHPSAGPLAQVRLEALHKGAGDVERDVFAGLILGAETPGAVPGGRKGAGRISSPEVDERHAFPRAVPEVPRKVCKIVLLYEPTAVDLVKELLLRCRGM